MIYYVRILDKQKESKCENITGKNELFAQKYQSG